MYFIVRDDSSHADLLFQTSDTTWESYNREGVTSTYGSFDAAHPMERAYKVSLNRPYVTRDYRAVNLVFNAEYPMVRWLESNGYDVTYFTGLDSDRRGELIRDHKVFMSVGHDEYWSGHQRENVEVRGAMRVSIWRSSAGTTFSGKFVGNRAPIPRILLIGRW